MANENYLSELVTRLLEQETSEEMAEIKRMIYRRIATESDIKLSRIPAPLNITEIGGYFNLHKYRFSIWSLGPETTLRGMTWPIALGGYGVTSVGRGLTYERVVLLASATADAAGDLTC